MTPLAGRLLPGRRDPSSGSVCGGPPLDVSCGAEGEKRSVALTAVDMEGFKKLNIDSEATNVIFVIQVVSHSMASTVPLPEEETTHKRTHARKRVPRAAWTLISAARERALRCPCEMITLSERTDRGRADGKDHVFFPFWSFA